MVVTNPKHVEKHLVVLEGSSQIVETKVFQPKQKAFEFAYPM